MITLSEHILNKHGGSVTAFAKTVGRSRPLIYRWMRDGAIWLNGRVYDPVTEGLEEAGLDICTECAIARPLGADTCPECGYANLAEGEVYIGSFHGIPMFAAPRVKEVTDILSTKPNTGGWVGAPAQDPVTEALKNGT